MPIYEVLEDLEPKRKDSETINNFLAAHPIGSYYITESSISPAIEYGGGWEKIEGRVLLGASSNYLVGDEGGEATHILTEEEMPSHTHVQNSHGHSFTGTKATGSFTIRGAADGASYADRNSNASGVFSKGSTITAYIINGTSKTYATGLGGINFNMTPAGSIGSTTATNQNTGGGLAHNNMMPYKATNIWYRYA